MKDVDELEVRRKRIVNLQNEARAEVDRTADTWTQASENYVNALPDMRATPKAIETRIHRAREKLRTALAKWI